MNRVFAENGPLAADMEEIVHTLADTDRAHFLFVIVEDETLRRETIAELGERLSGQRYFRHYDFLRDEPRSLPRFCRSIKRRDVQVCVCAYGLEALKKRSPAEYESAIAFMNNHREDVRDTQTALVLFMSDATFTDLLTEAPDFTDWRSAIVTLKLPEGERVPRTPLANLSLEEAEDYRRDVRRYTDMLARPGLSSQLTAEYQKQRGFALRLLGQEEEGRQAELEAARLFTQLKDFQQIGEFYLDYLVRANTTIDPRGVMQTTRQAALKLDEVYVSLTAKRQTAHARPADKSEPPDILLSYNSQDLERVKLVLEELRTWIAQTIRAELPQVVQKHSHIVLIGDPGAGKTTLMRFLTLHFALSWRDKLPEVRDRDGNAYGETLLPIPIRIAKYAEALHEKKSLSLRNYLPEAFGELNVPSASLANMLHDALKTGCALVLLDGLDEVIDPGERAQIARNIDEFVAANPKCRFIVTSRVAGYRAAPLGGGFVEFTLSAMEPVQISRFLSRWCPAYERHRNPDADEADVQRVAEAEVASIEQAMQETLGVRRLAANPLLLTILALIHRNGSYLPHRRVELYELAAKTLLRDWELARGIPGAKTVDEDEALRLLGPLAFWLHKNRPSGMADEREIKAQLAELLAEERGLDADTREVQAAVTDFLERVREHTGLFVERAPGQFGFMHLTFEEYFVAREMARRYRKTAYRIYCHRHEDRWQEPILLAIAFESKTSPERASDLIRTAILAQGEEAKEAGYVPSRYEDVLHRDLLLAAHAIGDCAGAEPKLIRDVVGELAMLWFDESGDVIYLPLHERIFERLRYLGDSEGGREAIRLFLLRLQDTNGFMRVRAAMSLGQLGQATPEVLNALSQATQDKSEIVRFSAKQALAELRPEKPKPWRKPTQEKPDTDAEAQEDTTKPEDEPGEVTSERVHELLQALQDADEEVRQNAAKTLGKLPWREVAPSLPEGIEPVAVVLRAALDDPRNSTYHRSGDYLAIRDAVWDALWNVAMELPATLTPGPPANLPQPPPS